MAARSVESFYERVLRRIGERGLERARPQIQSETLQKALVLEISTSLAEPRAVLYLPHHWAVYVHDGRGPVRPVEKRWLVWFQNPADDPRTRGGRNYPVRVSDARRLTPAEWEMGLEENARRRADGLEPYMIVTKLSGPVTFPKHFEFFTKGMEGFGDTVGDIVTEEMDSFVASLLPAFGGGNVRRRTAKFTI